MSLFDKRGSLFQSLAELHAHQHNRQSSSAKGRNWEALALQQALLCRDQAHVEKLVDQEISGLGAHRVVLLQQLQLCSKLRDETSNFAVLDIVVTVLHVVPPQDLYLTHVLVALPLQEIDLLEQLLLVELQLAHLLLPVLRCAVRSCLSPHVEF